MSLSGTQPYCRLLTGQDAELYQALRLQALQSDPDSFLADWETESQLKNEWFAREIEAAAHQPVFGYYGVFVDQTLVGYIQIDTPFFRKQRHVGTLYNLYIHPAYRRRGLAQMLWQHVLQQLLEHTPIEKVCVSYSSANLSVAALYAKLGFIPCGRKPKIMYWHGRYADEIELSLTIRHNPLAKTILVDAVGGLVLENTEIDQSLWQLLETYPQQKIIVTNADDQQLLTFGLTNLPYELFSLKHQPNKTEPEYFQVFLRQFGLATHEVVYFEHDPAAVAAAQLLGIVSHHFDAKKRDLSDLKTFLDTALQKNELQPNPCDGGPTGN